MKQYLFAAAAALALACATGAQADVVTSNNPAPGDSYSNAGPTNQGQAVGASGWYYNNVRNSGEVGISTDNPHLGNGSVAFYAPTNGKADIEFLAGGADVGGVYYATGSLGTLADFEGFSYDWYRDASSTVASHLHPSFRIILDADGNLGTTGDRGGIVFERVYNGVSTPTNQWVTDTFSNTTKLWNFGLGLGLEYNIDGVGSQYDPLSAWQAGLPNATILGFSMGVGSGWTGEFTGYVDNVSWTIDGQTSSYNFEVAAVPEPSAWALMILGFGAAGAMLRRRTSPAIA